MRKTKQSVGKNDEIFLFIIDGAISCLYCHLVQRSYVNRLILFPAESSGGT